MGKVSAILKDGVNSNGSEKAHRIIIHLASEIAFRNVKDAANRSTTRQGRHLIDALAGPVRIFMNDPNTLLMILEGWGANQSCYELN